MKRKTAHSTMNTIPRTTLSFLLAVLLCITSSLSSARESVRDQFRSLKSSGAEINNNKKQCTTPGSCSTDDSNYAADQIPHGRNNGQHQQQQRQGGRNDLRKRLANKLKEADNNDRDYDDEEGMDLRAKLDARLAKYEADIDRSSNSRPPKKQQQSRGGNRPPNKSHNNNNMPSANNNNNNDNGIYYKIPGEDPAFLRYLSNLEVYEVPEMRQALGEILEEMESGVGGITTLMQRHVERTLIQHQFPNGSGGSSGGSSSSVKYANFGSLLDVSTAYSVSWNGSTEFGGKPSWVASIFYRKDILKYEKSKPCRVDLKDDYDPEVGDDECCLLGVTIEDFVGVRPSRQKKEEHMELSAYWDILDHGKWRMGTILDLEFGNQKFDTIVANGALTGEDSEIVSIMEKLKSLLKPGGVVFFVGHEPPPEKVDGPEKIHNEILQVIESAKRVSMSWQFLVLTYYTHVEF